MAQTISTKPDALAFTLATTYTQVIINVAGPTRVIVSAGIAGENVYVAFSGTDGGAVAAANVITIPSGQALAFSDVTVLYVAGASGSGNVEIAVTSRGA